MTEKKRKTRSLTGVFPASTKPIDDVIKHLQNTPGLHGSHAAQALSKELQNLWSIADNAVARGEQSDTNLRRGPQAASRKRTKKAEACHEKVRKEARVLRKRYPSYSRDRIKNFLVDNFDFSYSPHTIYKIIAPLWRD